MASPNEITHLRKIMIKPVAWTIYQSPDCSFILSFTYHDPNKNNWAFVMTRTGEKKQYKTADAVLRDIARVQTTATVFCHLYEPV